MSDPLIDRGGEPVNAESIRARLSRDVQDQIDTLIARWTRPEVQQFTIDAWNGHEPELGRFDEDVVKEIGRNTI